MNVTLISFTPEARELLLFSKETRLNMSAGLFNEIRNWPEEKKAKELAYMLGTIQSSWEFVDYTFLLEDVSRAFTHQFVRTRDGDIGEEEYTGPRHKKFGSYAQQSQRTVDVGGFGFVMPAAAKNPQQTMILESAVDASRHAYRRLTEGGMKPQDARSIVPTNVATNIMAKFNLRTLSEMAKLRLCTRTQGEYQDVFRAMRNAILWVHPWTEPFLRVYCAATGVCCFPNYKECPIKPGIFNPDTGLLWHPLPGQSDAFTPEERARYERRNTNPVQPLTKDEIQIRWEGTRFEATPVVAK